jgi:hypothetical protein
MIAIGTRSNADLHLRPILILNDAFKPVMAGQA